jgi:hypothetical protein
MKSFKAARSERHWPLQLVRLFALLGLLVAISANVASLTGHDLVYATFLVVAMAGLVSVLLQLTGIYGSYNPWNLALKYPGIERLPSWIKYVVAAAWIYTFLACGATAIFFLTHGQVHGKPPEYCFAFGQCRPASPLEVRREDAWTLYFFSSICVPFFIYPAISFFFERRLYTSDLS